MSINSIAMRMVATANDLLEEAGFDIRYGIVSHEDTAEDAQPELPLEEVPEHDFDIGDEVRITNVKDGEVEILEGTIVDACLKDDEDRWYARAITPEGRKFRASIKEGETRNGTRFDLI